LIRGISGLVLGVDWDFNVLSSRTATPAQYGTAMGNIASYLYNYTMPNGKKFPLVGLMGRDVA
jgi:hypothetical protein